MKAFALLSFVAFFVSIGLSQSAEPSIPDRPNPPASESSTVVSVRWYAYAVAHEKLVVWLKAKEVAQDAKVIEAEARAAEAKAQFDASSATNQQLRAQIAQLEAQLASSADSQKIVDFLEKLEPVLSKSARYVTWTKTYKVTYQFSPATGDTVQEVLIDRKIGEEGDWTLIGTVAPDATSFSEPAVNAGAYFYRRRLKHQDGTISDTIGSSSTYIAIHDSPPVVIIEEPAPSEPATPTL